MCTGNCKDFEISGKSYVRPKHLISSLVNKRRVNRRSKEPSVYLDAILTNTIRSLKRKKSSKLKRLSSNTMYNKKHNKDSKISMLKKQCHDYDEEIDDLYGVDSFFQKLKEVSKNTKSKDTAVYKYFDDDDEIQELVNNFIETGEVLE